MATAFRMSVVARHVHCSVLKLTRLDGSSSSSSKSSGTVRCVVISLMPGAVHEASATL